MSREGRRMYKGKGVLRLLDGWEYSFALTTGSDGQGCALPLGSSA